MKHKQRPLYDRVIVKRLEAETQSRIVIAGSKEKPMRAEVLAVGKGKLHENGTLTPPVVAVGDIVLIGKYAGTVYEEIGDDMRTQEYAILREDDILTVFEKEG